MKVTPLAADSLGVRSMATLVETPDVAMLIDPSARLGPKRYGLEPHESEWEALEASLARIRGAAERADVLIVTHYHHDHYDPEGEFYGGKALLVKHPKQDINRSQGSRARDFQAYLEGRWDLKTNPGSLDLPGSKEEVHVHHSDGWEYAIGGTTITFSEALPHGPERTRLGKVTSVAVSDGNTTFLHSSDVQGPVSHRARNFIVNSGPDVLYLDGLPTYLLGHEVNHAHLKEALLNLAEIMVKAEPEVVIMDHHSARDLGWRERYKRVLVKYDVMTVAGYLGEEERCLEARRKELWGKR